MKKGIFFALLFGALFLLFLSMLVFYSDTWVDRERKDAENLRLSKFASIRDDVAMDLMGLLEINSVYLFRNSSHATIAINETLPISSPNAQLLAYKNFIEGEYAQKQNLAGKILLSLDTIYASPFVYFGGVNLNYSYSGVGKDSSIFRGSPSVEKYSLLLQSASVDPFSECGWESQAAGGLEVEIKIIASNCPAQLASLDPLSESRFFVNTTSGKYLNMSFGQIGADAYSLRMVSDGVSVNSLLNVTVSATQPIAAWLPGKLEFVGDFTYSTLIIAEN